SYLRGRRRLYGHQLWWTKPAFRHSRARHGLDSQRHGAIENAPVWIRLPDIQRLLASRDPARGSHGNTRHLRLYTRLDRRRRRRPGHRSLRKVNRRRCAGQSGKHALVGTVRRTAADPSRCRDSSRRDGSHFGGAGFDPRMGALSWVRRASHRYEDLWRLRAPEGIAEEVWFHAGQFVGGCARAVIAEALGRVHWPSRWTTIWLGARWNLVLGPEKYKNIC